MPRRTITGFSNPTVKYLRSLREKKHRKREGKFLAEGLRLLTDARESGRLPEMLVMADVRDEHPLLAALVCDVELAGGEILETSADILGKITGKGNPQAVIMVGAYQPCAEFIKLARQIKMNATFVNISFVGADALATALGDAGPGVYVTQVVPFPEDASIPVVGSYQTALKAAVPNGAPGFVSLEGYMVGRLAITALEKINGEPTRKALIEALTNGTYDLGGMKLTYGPNDNQGSDKVFLTVIDKPGHLKPVTAMAASS